MFDFWELNIETTNYCQAKCIICPHKFMKREKMFMKRSLWQKILDGCKNRPKAIHYHLNGEPLLHPDLPEIIAYGKRKNPISVHAFFTNGLLLGERAEEFLSDTNSLPDWIIVSFNGGTKPVYEEFMQLSFERTIESVRKFIAQRNKRGLDKPKIELHMMLTKETEPTIDEFNKLWEGWADKLVLGSPMNWAGAISIEKHLPSRNIDLVKPCPYLFHFVTILVDGRACLCCLDYEGKVIVGDAFNQTVLEIFNSDTLNIYREFYLAGEYDKLPLCKNCSFRMNR